MYCLHIGHHKVYTLLPASQTSTLFSMTKVTASIEEILDEISQLPEDWHLAGTVEPIVLKAIAKHVGSIKVSHSVETGSGKTTLLFSNLSENHTVFAVDAGNKSISSVNAHLLFNADTVEFIEGPSQQTLPQYQFNHKLQVALIDGPHGYPFPDLEYYYLYPHIEEGGLLLIDDIHIPTIRNLFNFLKEEEMFELVEVVQQTAFFRRTAAEPFNPLGDGWWLQKYNKERFPLSLNQPNPQRLKQSLRQTKVDVNKAHAEIARLKSRISAMESSKFWQFRTAWFTLKQKLGLTNEK